MGLRLVCMWWAVVDTMMNIWVPLNVGNSRPAEQLLASKEIICPCNPPPQGPMAEQPLVGQGLLIIEASP
jgi:hypothetical protein